MRRALVTAGLLVSALGAYVALSPARESGGVLRDAPADYGEVPDFELTDASGKAVRRADIRGPWVASFIFTRCGGQCPMMTAVMKGLASRLPGISMVSFSVDPADTPERLRTYAAAYGARWTFLGGPTARELSVKGFRLPAADGGTGSEPIIHSDRLVLVDPEGRIRGYFDPFEPAEVDRLVEKARSL